MKISKSFLITGTVLFSAVLVYGLAVLINLFFGSFLLGEGIMDVGYLLLTLAIFLPPVIYIAFVKEKHQRNILKLLAMLLFFTSSLYMLIYLTLELGNAASNPATFTETTALIVIFLLLSLFFLVTGHIVFNRSK